eukprot:m.178376 g.178376  ORF g.178376 m.178376 type:complete len:339 (+) comp14531_c0_seq1:68-1084(+)
MIGRVNVGPSCPDLGERKGLQAAAYTYIDGRGVVAHSCVRVSTTVIKGVVEHWFRQQFFLLIIVPSDRAESPMTTTIGHKQEQDERDDSHAGEVEHGHVDRFARTNHSSNAMRGGRSQPQACCHHTLHGGKLSRVLRQVAHEQNGTHAKDAGSHAVKDRRPQQRLGLIHRCNPDTAHGKNHTASHEQALAADVRGVGAETGDFGNWNHHHLRNDGRHANSVLSVQLQRVSKVLHPTILRRVVVVEMIELVPQLRQHGGVGNMKHGDREHKEDNLRPRQQLLERHHRMSGPADHHPWLRHQLPVLMVNDVRVAKRRQTDARKEVYAHHHTKVKAPPIVL